MFIGIGISTVSIGPGGGGGVVPAAPSNVSPPVISGIQTRGQTLSTTDGVWTNSPTSFAYQWKRGGVDIAGATNSTYLLAAADVGTAITVGIIATNVTGSSAQSVSSATGNIAALLSISGTPVTTATQNSAYAGFSVSGSGGHTPYTYSLASGTLPTGITLDSSTGAVTGTPTVVETKTGIVIRVTDADGLTADLASFQIDVAAAGAGPTNTVAPAITGTTTVGQLLTTTDGTWTGSPTSYAYQWKRNGTTNIGTNANTYTLVQADAQTTITCVVTATNGLGSTPASSNTTAEIMDVAAAAFFARITSQPNSTRKHAYNALFCSLRSGAVSTSNLLTKIDLLQIHAAHDQQTALLNLISSSFNGTVVNAPTFTADVGFDTNGTNGEVDTGYNPQTAGGTLTTNSICVAVWNRNASTGIGSVYGWFDGADGITISPNNGSGLISGRVNQASSAQGSAGSGGTGWKAINRSASAAIQFYSAGAAVGTGTNSSTGLNSVTLRVGRSQTASYAVSNLAAVQAGGSLTANEHLDLYNAVRAYMTAVGLP